MMTEKKKKLIQKCIMIAMPVLLALIIGYLGFYMFFAKVNTDSSFRADVSAMASDVYDTMLINTYDEKVYNPELMAMYTNSKIYECTHTCHRLPDLGALIEKSASQDNKLRVVYISLDPEIINKYYFSSSRAYTKALNNRLMNVINKYPNIEFRVLYPAYSIKYWNTMSLTDGISSGQREIMDDYEIITTVLTTAPNVKVYWAGDEEWIIGNELNYLDDVMDNGCCYVGNTNPKIKDLEYTNDYIDDLLLGYSINGADMELNNANASIRMEKLRGVLLKDKEIIDDNYDNADVIFFGDSIVGNFTDTSSIPGVVAGLTKCHVYNMATGGSSGTYVPGRSNNFNMASQAYVSLDESYITSGFQARLGLEVFKEHMNTSNNNIDKRDTYYVVHFGVNDYFASFSVDGYIEGMDEGINRLRENDPDAKILVIVPNQTAYFDYGRTIVDPYKEGGAQYIEYIEALREYVSGREDYESSVYMLDNYNMIQVYDDYSSHYYTNDGVHLNGYGRYLTGVNIARWLENLR